MVKAAIGEEIDNETLGGATTHNEISGVTESYHCKDDQECLSIIRDIFEKLGPKAKAGYNRVTPLKSNSRTETSMEYS